MRPAHGGSRLRQPRIATSAPRAGPSHTSGVAAAAMVAGDRNEVGLIVGRQNGNRGGGGGGRLWRPRIATTTSSSPISSRSAGWRPSTKAAEDRNTWPATDGTVSARRGGHQRWRPRIATTGWPKAWLSSPPEWPPPASAGG